MFWPRVERRGPESQNYTNFGVVAFIVAFLVTWFRKATKT